MKLHCDIQLPASKSESNRALMIAAYGGFNADFQNLSDSTDTLVLMNALREIKQYNAVIDIADCGTAARFLTTFLACQSGSWLLTGTERMKQRPIAPLVEALRKLGANIQYAEKEGFLPLKIEGKPLSGGKVHIDMSQSSQFASSMLLAAPMWPQGVEIELFGELSSLPYLDMTLAIMRHFGAEAERNGRSVFVRPKPYQPNSFKIEGDWSAASYWYEMAALSEECFIRLNGLGGRRFDRLSDRNTKVLEPVERPVSLQGDSIIVEWMKSLGVSTIIDGDSLVLRKTPFEKRPLHFDFSAHPDLFPTMVATCAGLHIEARFTGVSNLVLKESDRVEIMAMEMAKIGVELEKLADRSLALKMPSQLPHFDSSEPLLFKAHNDHRVVMSLAPMSLRIGAVQFDNPRAVEKSYPRFWLDAAFLRS